MLEVCKKNKDVIFHTLQTYKELLAGTKTINLFYNENLLW